MPAAVYPPMFAISEEAAAAIRTAFEQEGELSAVVDLRRRFPLIKHNKEARMHVRVIAGWQPLPNDVRRGNVVPLRKR